MQIIRIWKTFKYCFLTIISPWKYWQALKYCFSFITSGQLSFNLYSFGKTLCKGGLAMCLFCFSKRFLFGPKYSQKDFRRELGNLKLEFPQDKPENWIRISAVTNTLLEKQELRRPGVLLFLKPIDHPYNHVEEKLADLMDKALNSKINFIEVDKAFLENSQRSITEIVDRIQSHFSNGGNVVIVRDIDQVRNPDVLNLFHSMCDNDYAKHKRVCFIFTVTLPSTLAEIKDKITAGHQQSAEKFRDEIFYEKWDHIPVDRLRPLVARIGSSSILWL